MLADDFERRFDFMQRMTIDFVSAVPDAFWHFSPQPPPAGRATPDGRHGSGFAPFCKQLRHVVCVRGVYADSIVTKRADFSRKHSHYDDLAYTVVQHEAIHHGQWSIYASMAGFETPPSWRNEWVCEFNGAAQPGRQEDRMQPRTPWLIAAAVGTSVLLAISGWRPYDRATWLMEVMPVLIALPLLWRTYDRFPLTSFLYVCLVVHAMVLMVGGAYTYARVPFGFDLQHLFHLNRNPYDKIGHFLQGFTAALVAREVLIRGRFVSDRAMQAFLVVCVALAVSATYEFVEWGAALAMGQGADDFLGTQGDQWDTQSDMFLALIGSLTLLTCFARLHDRQLQRLVAT